MDRTALGRALVAVGLLSMLGIALLWPMPMNIHQAVGRLDPAEGRAGNPAVGSTTAARGFEIVAWGGQVVEYNTSRDATLVVTRFCSHRLCGPMVWIAGDHRDGGFGGPRILRPLDVDVVRVEAAPPVDPLAVPPSRDLDTVLSPTFSVHPVWPSVALRLAPLALVVAGVALAPRAYDAQRAGVAAALGLAGLAAALPLRGNDWLLVAGLRLLATGIVVAGAAFLAVALVKRRTPPALVTGMLLAAVAFLLASGIVVGHFPSSGAGD